jgi:photosystem II stability/assembly factor-like uncharacterized protein
MIGAPGGDVIWRIDRDGAILRSTDLGTTWRPTRSPVRRAWLAGSSPASDVCWIVGRAGAAIVTTDGERWESRPVPVQQDLVAVLASSAQNATVVVRDGSRYSTRDGGRTWTKDR